tara:strand:+ start:195 stop:548 length:354 start_codon:yes stop_codon:yes gene_type:complete
MKQTIRLFTILAISLVFLGGCATQVYHDNIISGQVVDVEDKEVVICVSDTDGLKTHYVFNVYRTVYDSSITSGVAFGYSRELVGKIRLGAKLDKHFAKAIMVSGDLMRNDMVEFDKD